MRNEVLLAIISKLIDERLREEISSIVPVKGDRGRPGKDGRDFVFSEHEETIKSWIKEYSLKFSDLSIEELESIKGPKGEDGHSFSFEECREEISSLISNYVKEISPSLKLTFSDLTEDDKKEIRGPRGQRGKPGIDGRDGRDGKDFSFEEHREFFESLRLKFSDLTESEVDSLKLKFSNLSEEEKNSLKLKFSDLTPEEMESLRGPRGEKGRKGRDGIDGKDGKDGISIMGPPGISGRDGVNGIDGKDGEDGKDAPVIERVELKKDGSQIHLEFEMSDGEIKKTNSISITANTSIIAFGTGSGSGGSFDPDTILTGPTECDYTGPTAPLEVLIDNNGNVLIGL